MIDDYITLVTKKYIIIPPIIPMGSAGNGCRCFARRYIVKSNPNNSVILQQINAIIPPLGDINA